MDFIIKYGSTILIDRLSKYRLQIFGSKGDIISNTENTLSVMEQRNLETDFS